MGYMYKMYLCILFLLVACSNAPRVSTDNLDIDIPEQLSLIHI